MPLDHVVINTFAIILLMNTAFSRLGQSYQGKWWQMLIINMAQKPIDEISPATKNISSFVIDNSYQC